MPEHAAASTATTLALPVSVLDKAGACRYNVVDPRRVIREAEPDNVPLDGRTVVSPPLIDVIWNTAGLTAGDTFVCTLTIRNRREQKTTYSLEPYGVLGSRAGHGVSFRFVDLADPDAEATAGPWLDPAVDSVTLRPRELARVPVTVTVPNDPPTGSAYASLNIVPPPSQSTDGDGAAVGIESQVAAVWLMKVGGEGRAKLHLDDVRAPKLRWDRDPWTLRAEVDNDGTLHATPTGRVRVRSLFGNTVTELGLRERQLLPGGTIDLEETWRGVPWFGIYRYDVRVSGADGASAPARAEGWFVALPPLWVLITLAVVLLLLAVGMRRRSRSSGWDDDEDDGTLD